MSRNDDALSADIDDAVPRPGDADDETAAAQLAEQVRYLYRGNVAALANLVVAVIATGVLWARIDRGPLIAWVAATAAVVAARIVLGWLHGRAGVSVQARPRFWIGLFVAGTAASGLLWGVLCAIVAREGTTVDFLFSLFLVAAITVGGLASQAAHLGSYTTFLLSAVLPMAAASLLVPALTGAVVALSVLYVPLMILSARNYNRGLLRVIRLQIENARLAEHLSRARDAVIEANDAKWQTLSHLSHELRTPLNAILGFSGLLQSEAFGPLGSARYREYAGHIGSSGTHVLDLVNEILVMSQAEAGRLTLDEADVDVAAVVRDCLRMIADRAAEARVRVEFTEGCPMPVVRADPIKLRQIVLNLLSNAVKFTRADGLVAVDARLGPDGGLLLTVRDTGIGMAADDIPKALMPFVRLQNAATRQSEGTGLGLPICKRLVERHGGRLGLASAPGVGTTATVHLPPARTVGEAPRARLDLAS